MLKEKSGATLVPKITVIVPVYNGAHFIESTLTSLSDQDFKEYEVLCVDDCSTDQSAQIIKSRALGDSRIRYFKTPENLGIVPKVMNYAAPFLRGEYFIYSSQDDLYSKDWLASLYLRAQTTKADAVLPDVEMFFTDRENNRRIIGVEGDRSVILSGSEAFVASLDWKISGNALWKAAFLTETGFEDFGMFADEYTVRTFFLKCEKVAFCDGVFFYRQDNPEAITKKVSAKSLDAAYNNFKLWQLAKNNGFDESLCGGLAFKTLNSLIKAYALVYRTPQLEPFVHKCDAVFDAIQSDVFKASLLAGPASDKIFPLPVIYGYAQGSRKWLLALARIKAALGSFSEKARRLRK